MTATTRLIVFDLDGTLSDSRGAIVACFQEACRELGFPEPAPADIVRRIGLPLERMMRELVDGDAAPALCAAYRDGYVAHDDALTRLFPGVEELLCSLGQSPLAIATSKSTEGAERSVHRAGIRHHFAHVLGHDSVPRPKPHPDMLLELMARSGHPPERTWMVGDTHFDLEMADQAGTRSIGVSWGAHGAAGLARWRVVHTMAELGRALRSGS